jgi:hypothetical protein
LHQLRCRPWRFRASFWERGRGRAGPRSMDVRGRPMHAKLHATHAACDAKTDAAAGYCYFPCRVQLLKSGLKKFEGG